MKIHRFIVFLLFAALASGLFAGEPLSPEIAERFGFSLGETIAAPDDDITDDELANLAAMPQLEILYLFDCAQITDAGLAHLTGLTNLRRLDLGGCDKITDAGLTHLQNLPLLENLNLAGCDQITAGAIRKLEKSLRKCRIAVSRTEKEVEKPVISGDTVSPAKNITDDDLANLAAMPQLWKLDLSGCNKITDAGLRHLHNLPLLEHLDLTDCGKITVNGFQNLQAALPECLIESPPVAVKLGIFYGDGDDSASPAEDITDDDLANLRGTRIRTLELSGCDEITDAGLAVIAEMPQLRTLSVSNCEQITSAALRHLAGLTQLRALKMDLIGQITDADLAHLAGLTQLRQLDLYECEQITDAGLAHLAGMTQMRELSLWYSEQITPAGMTHLRKMPWLRKLHLDFRILDRNDYAAYRLFGSNGQVGGFGFAGGGNRRKSTAVRKNRGDTNADDPSHSDVRLDFVKELTQLRELNISGCDQSTAEGLAGLAGLTQLRTLRLPDHLTDDDLAVFAGMTQLLHTLDLSGCGKITDAGLSHLQKLPRLRELNLAYCGQITDDGISQLHILTQLEKLSLEGCHNISDDAIQKLQDALPECEISDEEYIFGSGGGGFM